MNRFFSLAMVAFMLLMAAPCWSYGQAAPADSLKLPEGFKAELLYSVPTEQGSWVSMTTDPIGRLIASDQYGKLYRITPGDSDVSVEEIELEIGFAQGLLCAFDSLYVVSYGIKGKNNAENKPAGLYRVRDDDGDDKYDSVELLREFVGQSEHG